MPFEFGDRFACAIPNPRRIVIGSSENAFAIRAKTGAGDRRCMPFEFGDRFASAIPNPRRIVIGTVRIVFAIRAKTCAC
jgi:hypothetical protein